MSYSRSIVRNPQVTVSDKARTRAEYVIIVSPSLQKLEYGLGFFRAKCFLSNFYECKITCRNVTYKTVEQGYQAIKADVCRNERAYHDIMNSRFPSEAKRFGGWVKATPRWNGIKLEVMEELLFCKFRQHKNLYYQLLNTRPHDLFECTLCEYWGTGCKLGSIMLEERSWTGQNHLGVLLMRVRSIFIDELVEGQNAIV